MNGNTDTYTIMFAGAGSFIILRLRKCSRTAHREPATCHRHRHSPFHDRSRFIRAALGAHQAKWYSAINAAVMTSISGLARVVAGDTVVVGTFFWQWPGGGLSLCIGGTGRLKNLGQGDGLKKARPLDELLRNHPSQRKADDPAFPRQPSGSSGEKPTATMLHEYYLFRGC
jgi:hypothetical protein